MSLAPRSMLFVSGESPARFAKAAASGADLVCVDLEDAVHPDRKLSARRDALDFLSQQTTTCPIAIRINALDTTAGLDDLHALVEIQAQPAALLLPKIEYARDIALVRSWLGSTCPPLVALIETPTGMDALSDIASVQVPELLALMLGGADLCLELDAEFEWQSLLVPRSRLVNAAKAHKLQAWDVPHINLNNPDQLRTETAAVKRLGFNCKTAIHPKQLDDIHSVWQASEQDVQWAQSVLSNFEQRARSGAKDVGAFLHEGQLVDEPIIRRARLLIAQAAGAASVDGASAGAASNKGAAAKSPGPINTNQPTS